MSTWLSRTDFTTQDKLHSDDLNNVGNDLRQWGGNVNGGGNHLYNVILDNSSGGGPGGGLVFSVFGRHGDVVAVAGDYTAAQVANAVDKSVVYADPPWIGSLSYSKLIGVPAAGVSSVFGRTGAVVGQTGDYSAAMVTNAVSTAYTYADPPWITSLSASKLIGVPPAAVIGATQTPWLQDVSAAGHNLTTLNSINMNGTKLGIGTASPLVPLDLPNYSNANSQLRIGSMEFQGYTLNNSFWTDNLYYNGANWIYRLRVIWQRLDGAFSQTSHWGSVLVQPFFKRYVPYFTAASFPLARANEYEADAASSRLTCARSAAQALTSVHIVGAYLAEKYWPAIQAAAKDAPQPAFAPFRDFPADAIRSVPAAELQQWLQVALGKETSHADTHPCLAERLKALGVQAEFAPPPPGAGAEKLLAPHLSQWENGFDASWREHVLDTWKKIHERTQAGRARIVELRSQGDPAGLDEAGALELAKLEEEVGAGPVAALDLCRTLVEKHPDSLPIRYALARQLLQRGDAAGVGPMESVLEQTPEAVLPGAQLLWDFYRRQNDADRASHWQQRYLEQAAVLQAARAERAKWLLSDTIAGHQLHAEELSALIAQLKAIPDLTRAYLVRKVTRHFRDTPMYLLGFKSGRWWRLHDAAKVHALTQRIRQEVRFPGDTLIINIEGANSRFAGKIREVTDSRIL